MRLNAFSFANRQVFTRLETSHGHMNKSYNLSNNKEAIQILRTLLEGKFNTPRLAEIANELGIDVSGKISTKYDFAGRLISAATPSQQSKLVAMALGEGSIRPLRRPDLSNEESKLRKLCQVGEESDGKGVPAQQNQQLDSHIKQLDDLTTQISDLVSWLENSKSSHIEGDARQAILQLRVKGRRILQQLSPDLIEDWQAATRKPTGFNVQAEEEWGVLPAHQVLAELKDRLTLLKEANEHIKIETPASKTQDTMAKNKKLVFIVYGRNTAAYDALTMFLRSLGLNVKPFNKIASELGGSPYVGDIIRYGMEQAQAVIVIFTPDEITNLKKKFVSKRDHKDDKAGEQPRPNVIFEAGLAMALDREHTIVVRMGNVRSFSDLSGVHFVNLDNSHDARSHLRDKLLGTGCDIDQSTTEWGSPNRAGDFEKCVEPLQALAKRKTAAKTTATKKRTVIAKTAKPSRRLF